MAATSQQTFLVFETVVCALHLDLNEAFFSMPLLPYGLL